MEEYLNIIPKDQLHLIVKIQKYNSPIIPVGKLARELGLNPLSATMSSNISGEIKPDNKGGFIIRVNRHEPIARQRFILAHEIAHYLLHKDMIKEGIVDTVLYRSRLPLSIDKEANILALNILIPTFNLEPLINTTSEEWLLETSKKLCVTIPALKLRLDTSKGKINGN